MSDEFDELPPAIRGLKAVCRCNNIKYKTIEKTILAGAKTVKDVAARTGATTGYCGGSCTPDILKMITKLTAPVPASPAPKAADEADEDAWWKR
jgi:NAD(P)H-nitrite reductase large subunit